MSLGRWCFKKSSDHFPLDSSEDVERPSTAKIMASCVISSFNLLNLFISYLFPKTIWEGWSDLFCFGFTSTKFTHCSRVNNAYNKYNTFNMSVKCFVKYECYMCYLLLSMGLLLNQVITLRSIYLVIYSCILNI